MSRSRYDVNGRTVLITGAARGIGAGAAVRLHAKGANVALVGLEPELLEAQAARLGDRAMWIEADVCDLEAMERAVKATVERFGGVDVAIANAGIAFVGELATAPVEQVERTLAVNMLGVWRTDRAVLPQIRERKGYLLNIASLAAAAHAPLMAPYAASKAGVEALTDSLRLETAPTGARVGCAYFGFIDTDLVRRSFEQPATQVMQDSMPGFLRRPVPLERAIDTIDRAVATRAARAWAPRFVGPMLKLRGLFQPLSERRIARDPRLAEALRLAQPDAPGAAEQDPVLGVAAERRQPVAHD